MRITARHLRRAELRGDLLSELRGRGDRRVDAARRVEHVVQAGDRADALELARRIERHEPVRVGVGRRGVEPRMHRLVLAPGQGIDAVDRVPQPHVRMPRGQPVGVALRHASRLGHERESYRAQVADGRGRRDAVAARRDLGAHVAGELRHEQVDRALGAGPIGEGVHPEPTRQVALEIGGADRLPDGEPRCERGNDRQRFAHARDVGSGRHDVGGALGREHARRVRRHRCDHRHPATAGFPCEHPAGVAVAPRPERWSAHERVGPELVEPPQQDLERGRFLLAEEVVAAREGDVDAETRGGEPPPRALRAVEPHRRVPCRLLATEPGEELIHVVHDGHAGTAVHRASPVCTRPPR